MAKKKNQEIISLPKRYILISADLSLKRPGFCKLEFNGNKDIGQQITSVEFMSVDNKTKTKAHGQLFREIKIAFEAFIEEDNLPLFFVREQQVNTFAGRGARTSAAAKAGVAGVVGIVDYIVWSMYESEWDEIYPVTIKKLLTGFGKAEKQDVANAVDKYIGKQRYKNDDESDAAAVAVAWLIQHHQIKSLSQEDISDEQKEDGHA